MENSKKEKGFYQYSLQRDTIETLDLLGYKEPTPIQKEAIPLLSAKRDVIAKAQTGSGKTAAFGIPICDDVSWEENFPQALILEPARELAIQVQNELFQIGRNRRIKVPVVFGGMAINQEMISLKQKSHIVVGTPGRVLDHIRRGTLVLTNIRYIVIDEADLMLDMGFLEEVNINTKPRPAPHSITKLQTPEIVVICVVTITERNINTTVINLETAT
jgi:superfamily II DNA/RNA helicase